MTRLETVRVGEDAFDQLNITDSANDPTQHFYPVFLAGRDELFDLVRRSAPYSQLPRSAYDAVLDLLAGASLHLWAIYDCLVINPVA